MHWVRAILLLLLASAALVALSTTLGVVPPLGSFLDPFAGFWRNGRGVDVLPETLTLPGLNAPVDVVWDDRRVPHLFAQGRHDLYLAQGYVTARDRLWQMEFQTMAAGGRLSEILGARTLEFDRYQRRIGMLRGAQEAHELMMADDATREVVEAYVAGVNAWIETLDKAQLPVEYKLLNDAPRAFTTLHLALLLKYFQWDLTFPNSDKAMTRSAQVLGPEVAQEIYPSFPPRHEPIVPVGTPWTFSPVPVAPPVEGAANRRSDAGPPLRGTEPIQDVSGSNNWVVAGTKTASGHPILANDLHLGMNLPSVWYEIQLNAPGINVYGISAAGAPGVIFGFNQHLAWGGTSAQNDVVDWYTIEFEDDRRRRYRHGGGWREITHHVETIEVRGGEAVVDTVLYTHHGPISYLDHEEPFYSNVPTGCALRWVGLEPSNEIRALLQLNAATGYDEFAEGLGHFHSPQLNFNYADRQGNVALWHHGRFPLRWRGQGRTLLDGANPSHEWQGWIPMEHLPAVKNPAQGHLASANQNPVDATYPYYLGAEFPAVDRARRINEILRRMRDVRVETMRSMQNDIHNPLAHVVLPTMVAAVSSDSLDAEEQKTLEWVLKWNLEHSATDIAAGFFTEWWSQLYFETWGDEIRRDDEGDLHWPGRDLTRYLVTTVPESSWFDDTRTETREGRDEIVLRAFRRAHAELAQRWGLSRGRWAEGLARGTDFRHLARVPGFGRRLNTGGTNVTINATTQVHGPTWRMVAELGPTPRAWGLVAGGQSGHPGSAHYDDALDDWLGGTTHELLLWPTAGVDSPRVLGRTRLVRRGGS